MKSIYQQKGFASRKMYLAALAETVSDYTETELEAAEMVATISNLLGPEEDFDGLLSELADFTWASPNDFMIEGDQ